MSRQLWENNLRIKERSQKVMMMMMKKKKN